MSVTYNPLDPGIRDDPYPCYAALREEGRVVRNELLSMWMVTRHREVSELLKDPRLSSERTEAVMQRTPGYDAGEHPVRALLSRWLLFLDAPDHARLRTLVSKAFTPRFVRELRPRIEALCAELLAPAQESGSLDVLVELANPLPFEVIASMLGIPPGDRASLREWSDGLAALLGSLRPSAEQGEDARRCVVELGAYLGEVVERRRGGGDGEDLIGQLVAAEEEGGRLSAEEVLATCALLFLAGHETTTNLIGNGTLALLRHPPALATLRADPQLLPGAIEELLRFDSPVQFVTRVVREPLRVAGVELEPGQPVVLMIGASHRDPEAYQDPDRLDVTRRDVRHLAFGLGPHFCLGAALARLEAEVVFHQLLERFPSWELALDPAQLAWRPDLGFRGVRSLPLQVCR